MMPQISPDGSRVAYMVSQGSSQDLWVYDLERGIRTRIASGHYSYPVWSTDGRSLVFQAQGGTLWARADGAGQPQPLMRSKAPQMPFSFNRDGSRLAFAELIPGAGAEVRTVPVETKSGQLYAGQPQAFVKTASGQQPFPAFSPDGRWLAYANAPGGRYEVYVRAFPDNGMQVQISNGGGAVPVWSRNGQELFYRTEDQRIMVIDYKTSGNSFVAGKPRLWCATQLASTGLAANLDLAPDGKRFIVVMPAESAEPRENQTHVMLVTNFFDEVRRRVGKPK